MHNLNGPRLFVFWNVAIYIRTIKQPDGVALYRNSGACNQTVIYVLIQKSPPSKKTAREISFGPEVTRSSLTQVLPAQTTSLLPDALDGLLTITTAWFVKVAVERGSVVS